MQVKRTSDEWVRIVPLAVLIESVPVVRAVVAIFAIEGVFSDMSPNVYVNHRPGVEL